MLVLVTNTLLPYCYDIGHVLGLPHGNMYRFRYRKKWMDDDPRDPDKKHPAVIVLRDHATGDFVPCRFVQLDRDHLTGPFRWIQFAVGDFPSSTDIVELPKLLNAHLASKGVVNQPGEDLEPLVYGVNYTADAEAVEDASTRWNNVVAKLEKMECYENYSFGRIAGAVPLSGALDFEQDWSKPLAADSTYDLYVLQNKPYKMETSEFLKSPYTVKLTSDDNKCRVFRSHQRVVGKYDLLRYSFRTPRFFFGEELCTLGLDARREAESSFPPFPGIRFEFRVKPSALTKGWAAARIIIGFAALAFFIWPSEYGDLFEIQPDTVRALAMMMTLLATSSMDQLLKSAFSAAYK